MMASRRSVCGFLYGAFFLGLTTPTIRAAALPLHVDRLLLENAVQPLSSRTRTYRADAVVTVLSVPVIQRQPVGSVLINIREAVNGDRRFVALHFAGGSIPERTHGLEYTGSAEEAVAETSLAPVHAASFGFVTRTKAGGYEAAQQQLVSHTITSETYVVVEGCHNPGWAHYSRAYVALLAQDRTDLGGLIREVRSRFPTTE